MLAFCEGRYEVASNLANGALTAFKSPKMPPGTTVVGIANAQMTLGRVDLEEGRYQEADARFRRGLEVALDYGNPDNFAHLLEGFSGLASAKGQHQRALHLGGAADALREADGAPLHPAQRRVVDRWLTISREALGEDAASTAWTAGRSLPLERALEEAEDDTGATAIRLPS